MNKSREGQVYNVHALRNHRERGSLKLHRNNSRKMYLTPPIFMFFYCYPTVTVSNQLSSKMILLTFVQFSFLYGYSILSNKSVSTIDCVIMVQ